ncbi:MAG: hypothetical protein K6U11_03165 [bacterium]|nr:hypothetical protein [bacterium]
MVIFRPSCFICFKPGMVTLALSSRLKVSNLLSVGTDVIVDELPICLALHQTSLAATRQVYK